MHNWFGLNKFIFINHQVFGRKIYLKTLFYIFKNYLSFLFLTET